MAWPDQLTNRDAYLGAPHLFDGYSRVHEAMGGLADDDCLPPTPDAIVSFADALEDHDRVHEAMGGLADDL
jgi:hypothetical protein